MLGRNNLLNLLFAILIANYLGLNFNYLERRVKTIENVTNRLNVKRINNIVIINDGFNSNYNGFVDALEVLSTYLKNKDYCNGRTKKFVITAGIISGGEFIEEYNQKIAKIILEKADECYLVNSVVSKYIKEVFDQNLYEYHYIESFKEGYLEILSRNDVAIVLIENDIPDIYKG